MEILPRPLLMCQLLMETIARITNFTDVLALNEGDNLTLSGLDSSDTESDYPDLIYAWDSSHFDSDLDGDTTGEVDYYGAEYFIAKLRSGEHTITLTMEPMTMAFLRPQR